MEPTRILLLIILLGAVNCQNDTVITSEVLQDYDPQSNMVSCYFPAEFQGEFVTQVSGKGAEYMANESIQYSAINITFNAIPMWGYCRKRVGDNILLMNRYNDKDCIRCFRVLQRSWNVIEVFSEAGITHTALNRCYTYESAALASCSKLNSRSILYRTKEVDGRVTQREYCPFDGFYYFKYRINNNSTISLECNTFSSELNNCPDGSILQLKFKRCNFETRDIKYNCLDSWPGPNNSRYFALWDNNIDNGSPRYKCGDNVIIFIIKIRLNQFHSLGFLIIQ